MKYQIGSITSSNYDALAAFLHASDLSPEQIEKEIGSIHNLMQVNPAIDTVFQDQSNKEERSKNEATKMKNLGKYVLQHHQ